jgi:RHS repeat-associated protein
MRRKLLQCVHAGLLGLLLLSVAHAAHVTGRYSSVNWLWYNTDVTWSETYDFSAVIGPEIVNGYFQLNSVNASWVHDDGLPVQGDGRYSQYSGTVRATITYYVAPHAPVSKTVLTASFVNGSLVAVFPGDPHGNTGKHAAAKLKQTLLERLLQIGGPVDVATGAESFERTLFSFRGARDWTFGLRYNSAVASVQSNAHELGFGWSHPFQTRIRTSGDNLIVDWSALNSNTFEPKPGESGTFVSKEDAVRHDRVTAQSGGGWLLLRRDQSALLFNSGGQLVETRDPNGRKLTLTYTSGRLSRVADPVSATFLDFSYNASGRLVTLTDASNAAVSLEYSNNLLWRITNQNGRDTSLTYNASRELLTLSDHNGVALTTNVYDRQGRVVEQEDAAPGNPILLAYKEQGLPGNPLYAGSDTAMAVPLVDPGAAAHADFAAFSITGFSGLGDVPVSYAYDTAGRLISAIANSQTTTVNYDSSGELVSIVDSANQVTTIDRRIDVTVTDRTGRNWKYIFNRDLRIRSVEEPLNGVTQYAYDADRNLLSTTDALGRTTSFTYDARGNVLTSTDPAGKVTTFTYDAANNLLTSTDAANQTTTRTYDSKNNLLSLTEALGRTTTWTYDANSLALTKTLPGGGVYTYSYSNGRLSQVTSPNGVVTSFGYDANGRLLYREDAAGKRVTKTYDPAGNLLTLTNPLNEAIAYTYDHRNRAVTKTDPAGAVTTFGYDHNSNLVTVTDGLGKTTTSTYDAEDRLKTVPTTDPDPTQSGPGLNPLVTTYNYDDSGRLRDIVAADGGITTFEYDAASQLTAVEDATGARTVSEYNSRGLVTKILDPLNRSTELTYDDLGRRLTMKDPLNRVTTFGHDPLHRLTSVADAGSLTASQGFDLDGNRSALTNPAGRTTSFAYDLGGRRISASTPEGRATTQTYNARGLPQTITEPSAQATTLTYDDALRLSSVADSVGTIGFSRDAAGRILTVTEGAKTLAREYDLLGRLTKFTDGDGNVLGYAYDDAGRLVKLTYPDNKEVHHAYDAAGRLHKVTDWAGRVTTYAYDAVGRITQLLRPNGTKQTRSYDTAGQMLQLREIAADGISLLYSADHVFDAAGQLVGETAMPATASIAYSASQIFDHDNRLLTHNGAAVTHDPDGNLLSVASGVAPAAYTYDPRNRLTGAGGLTYTYDAEKRRVAVTNAAGATRYVHNPNGALDQVLVRTGPDGTKTFYVYGLGLLHEEMNGAVRYYHHNRRGDTVVLTNATGVVTDRIGYGVYGEIVSRTGTTSTPFLFNGRWGVQTDSNGLYYHRARYYHPALRRFLNQDVVLGWIGSPGSLNRFAYANGNPVSFIDPFGLAMWDAAVEVGNYMLTAEYWTKVVDNIQFELDLAGLIPVVGEFADGINAVIYTVRGDYLSAGLSAAAMLPAGGQAATLAKLGVRSADEAAAVLKQANAAEKTAGHHTIPRAIQKELPPSVRTHPDVRGRPGNPNIKDIPESTHKQIHSSPPGNYYPGGNYNRRFDELVRQNGGYDSMTPQQINQIRDQVVREFGL